MAVGHPGWSPVIPTTIATITRITTSTATTSAWPRLQPISQMSWLDHLFHILLLLSISLFYTTARWRRKQLLDEENDRKALCVAYEQPWKTPSWLTFYGLVAMTHSNSDQPTPWVKEHISSIQARWYDPKRFGLQRLLEKGIIPLHIEDGGIRTSKKQGWGLTRSFPWVQIPWHTQTKRRAYFNFVVPASNRPEVKVFRELLLNNTHKYAFTEKRETVRPGQGKKKGSLSGRDGSAAYTGDRFPLAVGAWSPVEIFLPIIWDSVLVPAESKEKLGFLGSYLVGGYSSTIPLLQNNHTLILRIEAGHWGYEELENFVLHCAQEARIRTQFPLYRAWEAAKRELQRCGIPVEPYFESVLQDAEEA